MRGVRCKNKLAIIDSIEDHKKVTLRTVNSSFFIIVLFYRIVQHTSRAHVAACVHLVSMQLGLHKL